MFSQRVESVGLESPGRQAGVIIRQHSQSIAEQVIARIYATQPTTTHDLDDASYAKSVRDINYHARYLAEALWADDAELFLTYIDWAAELFRGLGFSETILSSTLYHLQAELHGRFSSPQIEAIDALLIAAQTRLSEPNLPLPSQMNDDLPFAALAAEYLRLLLEAKRREATQLILDAVKRGVRVEDIYLHVFQCTQQELGHLWQANQINVAQEHYITAATQFVMTQLYPYVFARQPTGLRLVAASVGNELHELGVRMVADFFEMAGWDTYYLGANTPAPGVVRAVVDYRADVLAISATMTPHLAEVVALISDARRLPTPPIILVGGHPFIISSTLWRQVGADGTAPDARRAVQLAEQLLA
ncbi:cobalamin-dependent protein [Caldilinea sp.]|uniref:cobalamin B12-binding domain-containing protein n=1 Tax=Caldilinea sp. TaxID=2293560 RepID=UPI002CF31DBD|nr:cobalamin-dependent protein [Anaerolineales bacterium]HQY91514.1 cobalamin-dependent protein [Caldilinea sp.]